ncbi:hypothetical protein C8J57DRAFT_1224707 [Mycena rebaudengoi]|nr:hypothetical protein C8J57DRAFT_1224707 [Mycena rebaudengoi]
MAPLALSNQICTFDPISACERTQGGPVGASDGRPQAYYSQVARIPADDKSTTLRLVTTEAAASHGAFQLATWLVGHCFAWQYEFSPMSPQSLSNGDTNYTRRKLLQAEFKDSPGVLHSEMFQSQREPRFLLDFWETKRGKQLDALPSCRSTRRVNITCHYTYTQHDLVGLFRVHIIALITSRPLAITVSSHTSGMGHLGTLQSSSSIMYSTHCGGTGGGSMRDNDAKRKR